METRDNFQRSKDHESTKKKNIERVATRLGEPQTQNEEQKLSTIQYPDIEEQTDSKMCENANNINCEIYI